MEEVLRLRTEAGLSQTALARRSGVAQPNIAAYESGRRIPSAEMIRRLGIAARAMPHEKVALHRQEIYNIARKYGVTEVKVFGSVMRHEDRPDSDLDLLITAPNKFTLFGLAAFALELEGLLDLRVDIVTSSTLDSAHPIATSAQDL